LVILFDYGIFSDRIAEFTIIFNYILTIFFTIPYQMYNSDNQLQVESLMCQHGDKVLFSDLSLQLDSGKLLLLEGKNGAGKTTLLRILSGLRQADEGEVLWNKEDIRELGFDFYQHASFLGHHNALKLDLTAQENLEISIALSAGSDISIAQALSEVNLSGYEHEFVNSFSAGMCRRLAIAKLLVLDTPLWILDEPFTSVDVKGIAMIEQHITKHLQQDGLVVMTSHHQVNIDPVYINNLRLS